MSDPAEHRRFARHLAALGAVAEADEAELVTTVLGDEDTTMAVSAVIRHLDRRAAQLMSDPRFSAWAHAMAAATGEHDFLVRRLHEWTLLRRIAQAEPWTAEEVTGASDWLQRTAATNTRLAADPEVLGLLAVRGRTRRVRTAAGLRLRTPDLS
ncbi:hypothetical protein [Streptomyces sp.]|uniref:hypothetical protein n=1 Tax=Streptomyces sp. TaxID=1931 RepID=UPI002F92D8EF